MNIFAFFLLFIDRKKQPANISYSYKKIGCDRFELRIIILQLQLSDIEDKY